MSLVSSIIKKFESNNYNNIFAPSPDKSGTVQLDDGTSYLFNQEYDVRSGNYYLQISAADPDLDEDGLNDDNIDFDKLTKVVNQALSFIDPDNVNKDFVQVYQLADPSSSSNPEDTKFVDSTGKVKVEAFQHRGLFEVDYTLEVDPRNLQRSMEVLAKDFDVAKLTPSLIGIVTLKYTGAEESKINNTLAKHGIKKYNLRSAGSVAA